MFEGQFGLISSRRKQVLRKKRFNRMMGNRRRHKMPRSQVLF